MAKKDRTRVSTYKLLALILVLEILGAAITGIIIESNAMWYNTLATPITAPTWFLGGVWIVMYLLMAVALISVYQNKGRNNLNYIYIGFTLAAIIPVFKEFLFWQPHYLVTSTVLGALTWLIVLGLTMDFWHISRKASVLMLPVLLWMLILLIVDLSILAYNGILLAI